MMRRVLLESPFKGKDWSETEENLRYARACMRDCFLSGDAPFASAPLYTQKGVLNDKIPAERRMGIEAGLLWGECAEVTVVYVDRGLSTSDGTKDAIRRAKEFARPIEYWSIGNLLPDEDSEQWTTPRRKKVAFIESIVTDQGNVGSYCSVCQHNLDLDKISELDSCPGCKEILICGETHTNQDSPDL